MMKDAIYRSAIKSRKRRWLPLLIMILLGGNILIYGVLGGGDFHADNGGSVEYRNILSPKTKRLLKRENLPLKSWFSILRREEGNFYLLVHFFNHILKSPYKREIKLALIKYSVEVLQTIKKSYLLLDLEALVLAYWGEDQRVIRQKLRESLTLESNITLHPLLMQGKLVEQSGWIASWYRPKRLLDQQSFFQYLLVTKRYRELIDFIDRGELNISKKTANHVLAHNLVRIDDRERGERLLKKMIRETGTDYSHYYLAKLYLNQKRYREALKILDQMQKKRHQQRYLLLYPEIYKGLKQYRAGLYFLSKLPASAEKFKCAHYLWFIRQLPLKERSGELLKIKFICPKRDVYRALINVYQVQKNSSMAEEYQLKLRMLGEK